MNERELLMIVVACSAILVGIVVLAPLASAWNDCGQERAEACGIWSDQQFKDCVYAKTMLNVNRSECK